MTHHLGAMKVLALWLSVGCSSNSELYDIEAPTTDDATSEDPFVTVENRFYLQVDPLSETVDGWMYLPQTFGPFSEGSGFVLDLMPAVTFSGSVSGRQTTPWRARSVPTEDVVFTGQVILERLDGGRRYATRTDELGDFSIDVVPDSYTVITVPDDPNLPISSQLQLIYESVEADIEVGPGVSLWGKLNDPSGRGVGGIPVWAVDTQGHAGPPTQTDELGWYELKVSPGLWTVQTAALDRRPTLTPRPLEVGDDGARLDLQYGVNDQVAVEGQLIDTQNRVWPDVAVRLTSRSLVGYAPDEASYSVELTTNSMGFFLDRMPAGTYDIDVLPAQDDEVSPLTLKSESLLTTTELGELTLQPLRAVSTIVTGPEGQPMINAPFACTEDGPSGRRWETTTDDVGWLKMTASRAPLTCVATASVATVATERLAVPASSFPSTIQLREGAVIGGTVSSSPLPGETLTVPSLVQVVDLDDIARGLKITGQDGTFAIPVVWSP